MQGTDVHTNYTVASSPNSMDLKSFSSAWDSSLSPSAQSANYSGKKRNVNRACDACRRRKSKCDGPKMPDAVCTNCIQSRRSCTYLESSRPRGPPKAYVTGLEDRLEKLEALLTKLQPGTDFSNELGSPVIRDSWKTGGLYSDDRPNRRRERSASLADIPGLSRKRSQNLAPIISPDSSPVLHPQAGSSTLVRSTHLLFEDQSQPRTSRADPNSMEPSYDEEGRESSSEFYSGSDKEDIESPSRGLQRVTLRGAEVFWEEDPNKLRYHGHSSSFKFAEVAKKFKERQLMPSISPLKEEKSAFHYQPNCLGGSTRSDTTNHTLRRPEYWASPPWELEFEGVTEDSVQYLATFDSWLPPPDLTQALFDIYFLHVNTQFPLLHRPTFERHWHDGLFHRDEWFACLCFSLFAVASRWSNDPRVLPREIPGRQQANEWKLAGALYLKCAMEITRMRRSLFHPSCLFEVQSLYLQGSYLRGTAHFHVAWLFVSIAIRKSQDLGVHRRSPYKDKPSVEGELWKRAFWLLVVMDRMGSASLGRACVLAEEDFDIDLPLEVDDEYWELEDSSSAFKQPPGKASRVSFLNHWIKLSQIVSFALKTVYATNKPKLFSGVHIPGWREEVLEQLNTAMSEFANSIPDHLRWSENIEDEIFANQSVSLYTTYYLTQILIYRPFLAAISAPSPPSTTSSGSAHRDSPALALAICTQAARSCARILENQMPKGISSVPNLINVSHICAAALSVKIWDIKKGDSGLSVVSAAGVHPLSSEPSIPELMADINVFISALQSAESRWEIASYFLHMIQGSLPTADKTDSTASLSNPQLSLSSTSVASGHEETSLPRIATYARSPPSMRSPLSDPEDIRQWQSAHSTRLFSPPTLIRLSPQAVEGVLPVNRLSGGASVPAIQAYWVTDLGHVSPGALSMYPFPTVTPNSGFGIWASSPMLAPHSPYPNHSSSVLTGCPAPTASNFMDAGLDAGLDKNGVRNNQTF